MEVVKTTEGHIGLFTSTELQKDLYCNLCDFKATCAAKLKRHMIKPAKFKEKCPKCDLTFMFRSDLNRHVLTPHRDYVKGNSRSNQYRKIHNVISSCDSSTYRLRGCIITLVAFIWLFSAVCIRCVLKLPCGEDAKSHRLHLFDFSPLCVFKCVLKLPAWEDA